MKTAINMSVVKFIVNVRLMEKSVNSHVGRVMVVKVMIQYNAPGSTPKMPRITRANNPKVDEDAAVSAARNVVVAAAWETVEGKLAIASSDAIMTDYGDCHPRAVSNVKAVL